MTHAAAESPGTRDCLFGRDTHNHPRRTSTKNVKAHDISHPMDAPRPSQYSTNIRVLILRYANLALTHTCAPLLNRPATLSAWIRGEGHNTHWIGRRGATCSDLWLGSPRIRGYAFKFLCSVSWNTDEPPCLSVATVSQQHRSDAGNSPCDDDRVCEEEHPNAVPPTREH